MIVKIFKGVWFLSLLGTMAIFMYVYASLPETIQFTQNATISRNGLFYSVLGLIGVFNAILFAFSRIYANRTDFSVAWFHGLVILLNLFMVVVLQFVNLLNSGERFDFTRIGFIIYGTVGLMIVWAMGWPIYLLARRFLLKRPFETTPVDN